VCFIKWKESLYRSWEVVTRGNLIAINCEGIDCRRRYRKELMPDDILTWGRYRLEHNNSGGRPLSSAQTQHILHFNYISQSPSIHCHSCGKCMQ